MSGDRSSGRHIQILRTSSVQSPTGCCTAYFIVIIVSLPMRQVYFTGIGASHIILGYVVIPLSRYYMLHCQHMRYFRSKRLYYVYIDWVSIIQYILIVYSTCGLLVGMPPPPVGWYCESVRIGEGFDPTNKKN